MRTILAIVAFAALAVPATAAQAPEKFAFVSGFNDPGIFYTFVATTVRYGIVDGRISRNADFVYPSPTEGPVAVDADGRLYASDFGCYVTVYAPNSTRVERTLSVAPYPSGCGSESYYSYDKITAIAVDRVGHLFVSLVWEAGGSAKPKAPDIPAATGSRETCIYGVCTEVYAPGASGSDPPVQLIANNSGNYGMTTDTDGNLYLQDEYDKIDVIAHPATHPKLVRTIVPAGLQGASNPVIDDDGHLYVATSRCIGSSKDSGCAAAIAVFPETANGTVVPERLILPALGGGPWAMALNGTALWLGQGGPTIAAFDRASRGEQLPRLTFLMYPIPSSPQYLAVQP